MIKRMILMLLAVSIVLGAVFGYKVFMKSMVTKYMLTMGSPVQSVSTTKATKDDWQPKLEAVGNVRAVNGADISAEVAGIVAKVNFESGSDIEKDSILIELRRDDDVAKLQTLEAAAKLAAITYDRDLKQVQSKAIAQATVDNDAANLESARAQVIEQQAVLDKKIVKAPFSGHLGIRQVDVGQYLSPGTAIVTLQQLDPVYVDFNLPEQDLTRISLGQKVVANVTAYQNLPFEGDITSINAKVDEATRNVQVRATIKNPDRKLLPGMFAAIIINSGAVQHFVTLPQTAITYNPYGNTVFLVDSKDAAKPTAKQSFVVTGETRGDQIAILSGVKEGDEVVTSGQIKLRNGSAISINNEIQPKNDAAPTPEDK